jgi:superfamily I DNA/RNA helicase
MITSPTFTPSKYQSDIFRAVQSGQKAIVVAAVPGSGKTTTIQQLVRYIPASATVLMVAFNVDAAKQLQFKIDDLLRDLHEEGLTTPLVECRTIHSLGNGTLAQAGIKGRVTAYKYSKIAREYLRSWNIYDQPTENSLSDLLDKARLTLSSMNANSLVGLLDRFEIDIDERYLDRCLKAVPELLRAGIEQARQGVIDFTDMIWLPSVLNLSPRKYSFVLVDEAQDLSPAQRELVLKARKPNGAFVAVGDANQAIYGFAGASNKSIQEIIKATNAITLPLSICYRCPVSAVELASSIYPGIESAPGMPQGEIRTLADKDIPGEVRSGDLILCRTTAPLVSMCFELLRQGKRATVRGRDLGKALGAVVKHIQKFCRERNAPMNILNLQECADEYLDAHIATLQGGEHEMKRANIIDKIDTLICLFEHYKYAHALSSLDAFTDYINDFFKEDKEAQIILSTGHRAKGLEYPRVFILRSDKLPHPMAKTQEARIQEYNLMYVLYTRVRYMSNVPGSGTLFLGISEESR